MLARSLKKIWTDAKLVHHCSAKDKMVSNLTTILLYCFSSALWQVLLSLLSVWVVFFLPQVLHFNLSLLNVCLYLGWGWGCTWVGSNLHIWSCPAGYRPSYFVLEGGKGVGRSIRESQAPQLCRSAPRALAEDWWSVRAQSCLPDPSLWL